MDNEQEGQSDTAEAGYAYVYTFPYWIFIDENKKWEYREIRYKNFIYRAYPPHRHGKMPFLNTPTEIHIRRIPGLQNANDETVDPTILNIPNIGDTTNQRIIIISAIKELDETNLPKDSLRMDVLPIEGQKFQPEEADQYVDKLMKLVRWRTKQWWITRSNAGLSRMGSFPFAIDKNSVPVKVNVRPLRSVTVHSIKGDEKYLTPEIWDECLRSACQDIVQVPVYDSLLLEARYFMACGDIRQAVLEASSSIDICKEMACERLWCNRNPGKIYDRKRRDGLLRNWDYPRHLDEKFYNHFGVSYKKLFPHEWSVINHLSDARNNIAHGNANQYGDPPVTVNNDVCRSFLGVVQHCVDWLLSLH